MLVLMTYFFLKTNNTEIYGLLLYVVSVLLVGYTAFVILKLRAATRAVRLINESLEQTVEKRTTELVWSNDELKKSETNNKALLHAMPDSIWRTDRDGFFLDLIPAKGEKPALPSGGWHGKTIFDVFRDRGNAGF